MIPLAEKYRAMTFQDIKGQDEAKVDLKNFFNNFPKKRAIILNGPVGTGKTSLALALAREKNLELFELNASDLRNKSSLEEVLKPSTLQHSLFNKGKLILMDEADGITASDRGGLPELITLIETTGFPIIITANDIWQKKFSPLRQKCSIINMKLVGQNEILKILKEIVVRENAIVNDGIIRVIADKSKGDVRAALNDLQSILTLKLSETDVKNFKESQRREKQTSIFDALKIVFQNQTENNVISVYDDTYLELDEILLWVEENIPLEYQGKALAKAYDALSKADLFRGRIYRQQYWRFLFYQNFFLSAGVSAATKLKYQKFTKYQKPSRILKIWLSNQKNMKKKSITIKYAKFSHMSKKKATRDFFLLPFILKDLDQDSIRKMDLNEKELEYINNKRTDIIVASNINKMIG